VIYPPALHKTHPGPDTRGGLGLGLGWGWGGVGVVWGVGLGRVVGLCVAALLLPSVASAHAAALTSASLSNPPQTVGFKDTASQDALKKTYDPKTDFNAAVGKLPIRMDSVRQYCSSAPSTSASVAAAIGGGGMGFAATGLLGGWGAGMGRLGGVQPWWVGGVRGYVERSRLGSGGRCSSSSGSVFGGESDESAAAAAVAVAEGRATVVVGSPSRQASPHNYYEAAGSGGECVHS